MEKEKENRKLNKLRLKNNTQKELDTYFIKKKNEEEKLNFDQKTDNEKLSLPLKNEEEVENFKKYFDKLTEKIDTNINKLKEFKTKNILPRSKRSKSYVVYDEIFDKLKNENLSNENLSNSSNLKNFKSKKIKNLVFFILIR